MEKNQGYVNFLEFWHEAAFLAFFAALAVAIFIFIIYKIRYASAGGMKEKYELASEFEIKNYLRVNYAIAVAIIFIVNTIKPEIVALSPIWLFIRLFISICLGTLHAYVAFLLFKYYYPGQLEKKLKRLRYTPRINNRNGNKMKLLGEDEEDAYLDEGMQAEEDAFSVDYDVWLDEETGDTHIEKYKGHLAAFECDRCGFQTLKLQKEEIISEATDHRDGEILKEYKCGYCGRIKRKSVGLTRNVEKSVIAMVNEGHDLEMIKVEIHTTDGENRIYEFQNLEQAKHFLEEFDLKKLNS